MAISTEVERLQRQIQRLEGLVEVGVLITSTLELDEVLRLVLEKAQTVMEAEASSVLLYHPETETLTFGVTRGEPTAERALKERVTLRVGEGIAGWVAAARQTLRIDDAQQDSRFDRRADRATGLTTRAILAAPLLCQDRLVGVAEVLNPRGRPRFDDDDQALFEAFCRQVAIAVANAQYHQAYLAKQRIDQQLDLAATLQRSFLPPALERVPTFANIRLAAHNLPALEIGGDLYDYFDLGGGRLAFVVGDVSGKGIAAALYMARAVSELRAVGRAVGASGPRESRPPAPSEVLQVLNDRLIANAQRGMFLTLSYGVMEMATGQVWLANAGHPPAILLRGGKAERLPEAGGPPLGIQAAAFPTAESRLLPGDALVLVSDGVLESRDAAGKSLEYEGLLRILEREGPWTCWDWLLARQGDRPRRDDMTLLVLQWTPRS